MGIRVRNFAICRTVRGLAVLASFAFSALILPTSGQAETTAIRLSGDFVADLGDSIKVALVARDTELDPGDTLFVDLTVVDPSPQFNAFDAYVSYDKNLLTFLSAPALKDQVGPLMTDACSQDFHLFTVATDSSHVSVNYSLMCGGVSVAGPGVIYRLSFLCGPHDADTALRFYRDPPETTRFFMAGSPVRPISTQSVLVRIGAGSSPTPPPLSQTPVLSAAPNPFNPRTTLSFELTHPTDGLLAIYTVTGRRVRTLHRGSFATGPHRYIWDGRDDSGFRLATGCYIVRLQLADERESARTVTLLK